MSTPGGHSQTLEYANGRDGRLVKPVRLAMARRVRLSAVFSVGVGVTLLLLYRLTGRDVFSEIGAFWLLAGGTITTVAFFWSIWMLKVIRPDMENAKQGNTIYLGALLISLLSYPVALGCVVLGGNWMQGPHFVLRVYNVTAVDIEQVTVHFAEGDVSVGPIAKQAFAGSGRIWHGHDGGPLAISVKAGDLVRRKVDREYCGYDSLRTPYYDIYVEDGELPQGIAKPAASTRPVMNGGTS